MNEINLTLASAVDLAAALREGRITSEALVAACLARIDAMEGTVRAWTFLDPEHALAQAREADAARARGEALGPLHGIPVGVKDIFDTRDMPTENGTVLHAGRRPGEDAAAVAFLRAAGAVILGKTVTTELAVYAPGATTNPRDPARTPGGSSSGSAAAVAACMVPLAIGSQTNGSTIRPASFCGVVGYKSTHGFISRHAMLTQSPRFDHVGVFARSVLDAALAAEPLMAYDARDPDMRARARPALFGTAAQAPPTPPRLAFVKTPMWDGRAEEDAKAAFTDLVRRLGPETVEEVELPPVFGEAVEWHRTMLEPDIALHYAREYERGRDRLSERLRGMIEYGLTVRAVDYHRAAGRVGELHRHLDDLLSRFDALLTPAAPGEAPVGLGSTGDPIFCTLWTLCGTPAVSLPLLQGKSGMPIGAQLVGARGADAALLRTARWLESRESGG